MIPPLLLLSSPTYRPDGPDYDGALRRQMDRNIADAQAIPTPSHVIKKVVRDCRRFGTSTPDEIIAQIRLRKEIAQHYAKSPGRQGLHQTCLEAWLRDVPFVIDAAILPGSGRNARIIDDDGVRTVGGSGRDMKSIDFSWKCVRKDGSSVQVWASHKHTAEGGGAQDNQFNDLKHFLRRALKTRANAVEIFLAVADGDYYDLRLEDGRTRIQALKDICASSPVLPCGLPSVQAIRATEIPALACRIHFA